MTEIAAEAYAQIARTVAREAAQVAMAGFRKRPTIREKRPADLVTEFDLASERWIRQRLSELTPEIAIVGEEEGGTRGSGLVWYCDPIDGTTNFAHGHPFWCVSIGLGDGEQPIAGAVVAPALALEWHAARGVGAFRNDEPCRVSENAALESAYLATGFPARRGEAPANNFDSFFRVKQRVQAIRRCGAAAIDLCLVADGTYDAYWERSLSPWDFAAGAAICQLAGGRVETLGGGPLKFAPSGVFASNGLIHDQLAALIGA
jgi:myo-inositol-1(or 4)-monophosphatase